MFIFGRLEEYRTRYKRILRANIQNYELNKCKSNVQNSTAGNITVVAYNFSSVICDGAAIVGYNVNINYIFNTVTIAFSTRLILYPHSICCRIEEMEI